MAGALGASLAGVILDVSAFPTGAAIGEVPAESLFRLGLIYGPALMMFSLAAAWFISRYQLDRAGHASALATLGRAGSAEPS